MLTDKRLFIVNCAKFDYFGFYNVLNIIYATQTAFFLHLYWAINYLTGLLLGRYRSGLVLMLAGNSLFIVNCAV